MKTTLTVKYRTALSIIILLINLLFACHNRGGRNFESDKIPFNVDSARKHVRPYELLKGYIDNYQSLRDSAIRKQSSIFPATLPTSEYFNRDAIIALLNGKGVANARIYLGRKPNDTLVFCIIPVDKYGRDLQIPLIDNTNDGVAIHIPGISSAEAKFGSTKEGLEDGQRP